MKITYKKGTCKGDCGKSDVLLVHKSLGLCQFCDMKRKMKKYAEKRKERVKTGEKADKNKLQRFYKTVWEKSEPYCYETGERLWRYHSWHVHHVLHKEDYPLLAFNEDICVLLTLEQHMKWHDLAKSDRPRFMPRTWAKYLELCNKYNIEP